MRAKLCQGRGLVGSLAGLLGDPVEVAGAHSRIVVKRANRIPWHSIAVTMDWRPQVPWRIALRCNCSFFIFRGFDAIALRFRRPSAHPTLKLRMTNRALPDVTLTPWPA